MTYNCCDRMANYRTNQKSLIMSFNTKRKRLSQRFSMVIIGGFIISILLIIPSVYGNNCPVLVQERCDFNYILEDPEGIAPGIEITKCQEDFEYPKDGSGDGEQKTTDEYYCPLNSAFEGQTAWGVCNGGCFEDDKSPKDFSGDPTAAIFCKIKKTDCVFPFVHKGETHNSCIKREDTFWCATKVNDDLEVIVGFWGKCDVDEGKTNCDPNWTSTPEAQTDTKTMDAVVKIDADTFKSGVSADITIQETDTEITIKGTVQGLPSNTTHNKFGFHIHEHPFKDNDCTTAGTHFNPTNSKHGEQESILGITLGDSHIGDLGNLESDENGEAEVNITFNHSPRPSLSEGGETSILGRTLVIHSGEDDLTPDGDGWGNAGSRLACGIVSKPPDEEMAISILIIILVVVAIIIIAILICVICYYCKRSKNIRKEKLPCHANGIPDPVDTNGYKPKKALFDELSIPFIDASPAPSPKPGRSTDRLSFFHRSSSAVGSRGSLSDEGKC